MIAKVKVEKHSQFDVPSRRELLMYYRVFWVNPFGKEEFEVFVNLRESCLSSRPMIEPLINWPSFGDQDSFASRQEGPSPASSPL